MNKCIRNVRETNYYGGRVVDNAIGLQKRIFQIDFPPNNYLHYFDISRKLFINFSVNISNGSIFFQSLHKPFQSR